MGVSNLFEDEEGWTNRQRAEMAARAAYGYADGGLTPESQRPMVIELKDIKRADIVDLMTDLYHLVDQLGLDLEGIKSSVSSHYEAEQETSCTMEVTNEHRDKPEDIP